MTEQSKNQELEHQNKALVDLTHRARAGIPIYLAIWIIVSLWADFPSQQPLLFYGNLGILLLTAIARIAHLIPVARDTVGGRSENETLRLTRLLEWLLIIGGLHWGLMSAWLIYHPDHIEQRHVLTVVLAAFAMGGTSILSISHRVRRWYPIVIYAPSAIAGLILGGAENYVLVALLAFSILYIHTASRIAARDYYDAVRNEELAGARLLELRELSNTDPLTQLSNRKYFNEKFMSDWQFCLRNQLPLSVLMIDLDHFKSLNDSYGHLFGDHCLQQTATVLRNSVKRATDTLARYGGEEFVVLMPGTQNMDAFRLGETIVRNISTVDVESEGHRVDISCSVGVAMVIPQLDQLPEELIEGADKALYRAKRLGRNRCLLGEVPQPPHYPVQLTTSERG